MSNFFKGYGINKYKEKHAGETVEIIEQVGNKGVTHCKPGDIPPKEKNETRGDREREAKFNEEEI